MDTPDEIRENRWREKNGIEDTKCIYCKSKGRVKVLVETTFLGAVVHMPFFKKCDPCKGFGYV